MKLDESDYENIFLRVRGRLIKHIAAILFGSLALFGISSLYVARERIGSITESTVHKYIESEKFKKEVAAAYDEKLSQLQKRTLHLSQVIADQEKRAAQLSQAPVIIDDTGLVITNKDGEKFHVETGTAKDGSKITFKNNYKNPPVVVLSLDASKLNIVALDDLRRRGHVVAVRPSLTGFEIPRSTSFVAASYRWVAFGR